LRRRKRN